MKRLYLIAALTVASIVLGGFFAAREVAQSSNTVGTSGLTSLGPSEQQQATLDHFKCYEALQVGGDPPPAIVALTDQFTTEIVDVMEPQVFCNPVDKNGSGIIDPDAHEKCYFIVSHEPVVPRDVLVTNQFGDMTLRLWEPYQLCLPTQKVPHDPPVNLDHYKCYMAEWVSGDPPPPNVTLTDQFGTEVVDVGLPIVFCNPVDKLEDPYPIYNPEAHLTCYQILGLPAQVGVQAINQFGSELLELYNPRVLCVPSTKTLLATPTPTNTPTNTPTPVTPTNTPTNTPTPITPTNTPTPTPTPTEVPPEPQNPSFSISQFSVQAPLPYDPAALLTLSPPPPGVPPPMTAWPCGLGGFNWLFCGSAGGPQPWDDMNALSLGNDFTLPPPDPDNPDAYLYFSVDAASSGLAGTGVNAEVVGCVHGLTEAEADEFGSAGTGANYQYFDGDGVPSCLNPPARPLGLIEPLGDDLDAIDPQNLMYAGFPVFVSLDATSPTITTAPPGMFSAGDIFFDLGAGVAGWYAPAGVLGLDTLGPNTDDIDALCINDADGDATYSPGDTVWFSLAAGSASLGIAGDSPADVFAAPFVPGSPVRTAAQLGLLPTDELDALKCYELPCVDRLGDTQCDDPVNDPDDDGCADWEEQAGAPYPKPGSTGAYDPNAWYDFYDVPVPAKADAVGANGKRNAAVNMSDVLAVLFYVGTTDNGGPNVNGVDYDTVKGVDLDGDTDDDAPYSHGIEEGLKYDRSVSPAPNPPWNAGPPNGAITLSDVLAALAQVPLRCTGGPPP